MPANRLMTVQVYSGAYQTFDNWGMRAQYMLGYMLITTPRRTRARVLGCSPFATSTGIEESRNGGRMMLTFAAEFFCGASRNRERPCAFRDEMMRPR